MAQKRFGLGTMVVGVVIAIANWYQPTRTVLDTLKSSSGLGGQVADFFFHPAFGLVLLALGAWWVFFKGPDAPSVPPSSTPTITVNPTISPNISPTFNNVINVGGPQEPDAPRIVVKEVQVVRALFGVPHLRALMADFIEVFFLNEPITSDPRRRVPALNVAGHVTFYQSGGTFLFGPLPYGRWAHIPEPTHERFLDVSSRTDIPADGIPKKLNIALKHVTDRDAFGFSNETVVFGDLFRMDKYRLTPGVYEVKVQLLGTNVDETFWFDLVITEGVGSPPFMQSISRT